MNHRPHRKKYPRLTPSVQGRRPLIRWPVNEDECRIHRDPRYRDLPLFGARWAQALREGA